MKNLKVILTVFLLLGLLVFGCKMGLEPAWKNKGAELSFYIPSYSDSAKNSASRAILEGDGYLYLITASQGQTTGEGTLYGPYSVRSGEVFKTQDIPAGEYELGIIFSGDKIGAKLLKQFKTIGKDGLLLGGGLKKDKINTYSVNDDDPEIISANVVNQKIIKGRTNNISTTLIPFINDEKISQEPNVYDVWQVKIENGDGGYTYLPTANERTRRFISFEKTGESEFDYWIGFNFYSEGNLDISRLASYDKDGTLLELHIENQTEIDEDGEDHLIMTSDDISYLYIEYEVEESLYLSGEPKTITYASQNGDGDGDGKTPATAAKFENGEFEADIILLVGDIKLSGMYTIRSNLTIGSYGETRRIYREDGGHVLTIGQYGTVTLVNLILGPKEFDPDSKLSNSLIEVDLSCCLIAKNVVFENWNNTIEADGGAGGALEIHSGIANLYNCEIRNCQAVMGGGIYLYSDGELNLKNTTIKNCRAVKDADGGGYGGGIYVEVGRDGNSPTITGLDDTTFINNTADVDGDNIYYSQDLTGY